MHTSSIDILTQYIKTFKIIVRNYICYKSTSCHLGYVYMLETMMENKIPESNNLRSLEFAYIDLFL